MGRSGAGLSFGGYIFRKLFRCVKRALHGGVHVAVAVFGEPSAERQARIGAQYFTVLLIERLILRVRHGVVWNAAPRSAGGIGGGLFPQNGRAAGQHLTGQLFAFGDPRKVLLVGIVNHGGRLEAVDRQLLEDKRE